MDANQRKVIREKKPDLLQDINCTDLFLTYFENSDGLIKSEIDTVKVQRFAFEGNSSAVAKLLECLERKTKGWELLVNALRKTQQHGALKLLLGENAVTLEVTSPDASRSTASSTGLTRSDDIQVGTPKCKIVTIVTTILDNPLSHLLLKNLHNLGRYLDIESGKRKQILETKEDDCDKLEELLETWKLDKSSEATLKALYAAIEKLRGYEDIIKDLETKFECPRKPQS